MALETGTFISELVATNPTGSDPLAFADDHLRLIKSTLKSSFPNVSGAVNKTHLQINDGIEKSGGTMTGPLVLSGAPTLSTHAANKAYVDSATGVTAFLSAAYPVGSIYINAATTTNPATLLGFGNWVEFGSGRVMVGQSTGDASFDSLEETGGSKDAVVVSHSHTATVSDPGHTHTASGTAQLTGAGGGFDWGASPPTTRTTNANTTGISVSVNTAGVSGTNANLQPYVVVKMWKRTA